MQIRRTLMAGTAVAVASLAVISTAAAAVAAPAAKHHDVLTIGKVGGANVKKGAVLKASLAKGKNAVFSNGLGTLTCKKSSFTAKVTKNPTAKGTADESTTAQTATDCTIKATGVTVTSITVTVNNLPYKSTVSDKKGDPVTVSAAQTTIVLDVTGVGTVSCVYTDAKVNGNGSNKHQTITFKNQTFTLDTTLSNPASDCELAGTTGEFSATYGPVKDTSVKHSPSVYVN